MSGPGEYVPDVTEGITRVEDLPKPRIERRSRNWSRSVSKRKRGSRMPGACRVRGAPGW